MSLDKRMSIEKATKNIRSGQTIMVGGFGLIGSPLSLINALTMHDVSNLTVISNNVGEQDEGFCPVLSQGKIEESNNFYCLF